MPKIRHHLSLKAKRRARVRSKLFGTAQRPRLTVYRSNKYTYVQVIDDQKGVTLVAKNNAGQKSKLSGSKSQQATQIATTLSEDLQKKKITKLVFDRGHYKYHGRVKVLAETLREKGITI